VLERPFQRLDGQASDPVARTISATTTHPSIYGMVRACAAGAVCDPNPAPSSSAAGGSSRLSTPVPPETRFGGPVREGQVAADVIESGPQILSPLGGSDVARGMVFSNETGGTYGALAEAPREEASTVRAAARACCTRCSTSASDPPAPGCAHQMYFSTQSPLTCRVAALMRFQRFATAIDITRPAS
jgi:hypothetical protein